MLILTIFIDENAHFFVGFKLENATQYINCEHIGKENFLKMVEFVENNLTIPRKIYLYEQEVTLQFDNIENVYKLTEKNRPDYPTSNTLFYSVFTLVIIGTLAIIFYDLPWLISVMIMNVGLEINNMLKSLDIKNFTVFSDARLEFSKGLNVIIGDNATGKSHLLKLGYSVIQTLYQVEKALKAPKNNDFGFILNKIQELENALPSPETKESEPFKAFKQLVELKAIEQEAVMKDSLGVVHNLISIEQLQQKLADKLHGVFKPDYLGSLNRNGTSHQRSQITVELRMPDDNTESLQFSFANHSRHELTLEQTIPRVLPNKMPLFFPTREVLTLHPEMTVLYEERYLSIDETHYDLCKALSLPLLKQLPNELTEIIKPLEAELGGKMTVDKTGRFYLDMPNQGQMEISLIAEGLRKMAMLVYLIQNGSLGKGSLLFWDETEANLNSRIMVKMANVLAALAQKGIQVILATHDLFLMKELSLLIESTPQMPAQFFSLRQEETGIIVEQGRLLEDLQTIVALDEALAQDDREQDFYYKSAQ